MARSNGIDQTEKARNAARIIRTIWKNPLISRYEIAERLHLERSTITHQVNRLLELGLITEISEGQAGPAGGRKPIHLAINKDYGYIIGIEMQVEAYSVVAVNLAGEVLQFKTAEKLITSEHFIKDVLEIAFTFAEEMGGTERLIGVGVGMGGIIDSERGIIHYSIPLHLTSPLDFMGAIAERTHIPFLVGNDANCCAWGELAFHKADGLKNFLFTLVQFRSGNVALQEYGGVGVGFGIVIDSKVYTGTNFTAGEFRSAYWTEGNRAQFSIPYEEIITVTRNPHVLERFTRELARNVALFVNTFNLNKVFIGGDIEACNLDVPAIFTEEIRHNWMYPSAPACESTYSTLGEKAVSYGAAGMLLYRIFTSSHLPVDLEGEQDPLVLALHL
ncbi:ROK family transcriptional regulator [Gracilinema caldarium]|uniref:ROK family protein n=1 Tax=Gracilinema caldarium (strain ATCC 51460 / DSM 7334 / H1) TaxID=744872 RepID=F8EWY9_GRAC1|nr:ROK family transcriptional regulator [Gracilinema caldarium]AEJ18516.1 ROK family protein [Gracilinema caldarium DSM 7334]